MAMTRDELCECLSVRHRCDYPKCPAGRKESALPDRASDEAAPVLWGPDEQTYPGGDVYRKGSSTGTNAAPPAGRGEGEPKRYNFSPYDDSRVSVDECKHGYYVLASDYDALAAENKKLNDERDQRILNWSVRVAKETELREEAERRLAERDEDAERWNLVPMFLEKYQINYVGLLDDIDRERKA